VIVLRRRVEGEHGGRRRERAARQATVPVVGAGPPLEQPPNEGAQSGIELIAVGPGHDGWRRIRFHSGWAAFVGSFQMAQCQQRIVGVFAVGRAVRPGAEEAAAVGPERVDEIEARIPKAGDWHVQR